jgi:branched-subunit amino acid transport protein AzlD
MNAIRAKIIGSWLLFVAWACLIYLHHLFIAWCIFGLVLLVRNTKPKTPQLPQRIGYILSAGLIAFLVFALIDANNPFPPGIHTAGEIIAALILWPLLFYAAYLDFKAFKATREPGV